MGTMFTVVALVYLYTGSTPPEAPFPVLSKHTFVGMEECQDYMTSPAFVADRAQLQRLIAQETATIMDQSVQAVVITASCQEDNRL